MSMSKEDFSIGVHLINAVCNKPITTNDTLEVYYSILKDLEFKTYKEAILKLIREKEFIGVPFSPAEIINAYNEISGKSLEIDRIIDILKLDVIKYGPNKPAYSEEIEAALLSIGGWDVFCNIENGDYNSIKVELGKQNIKDKPIRLESKRALLS